MLWKLPLSEHGAYGLICCRLDPLANDPVLTSVRHVFAC